MCVCMNDCMYVCMLLCHRIHLISMYCMYVYVVVLYAVSAVYFAGVMVRLMLTLTPIVCILGSIAISRSLDNYMKPMFSQGK